VTKVETATNSTSLIQEESAATASAVLAGVRLIGDVHGIDAVGIWSDLDSAEVRVALAVYGSDQVPVRYLDGADVPMKYKLRRVPGEPVPAHVRNAMVRAPNEPWKVRDRLLAEMGS
jgi:hypothetical protein